jgi:hypothetical protein
VHETDEMSTTTGGRIEDVRIEDVWYSFPRDLDARPPDRSGPRRSGYVYGWGLQTRGELAPDRPHTDFPS